MTTPEQVITAEAPSEGVARMLEIAAQTRPPEPENPVPEPVHRAPSLTPTGSAELGNALIVTYAGHLPANLREAIRSMLQKAIGSARHVIVLDGGPTLVDLMADMRLHALEQQVAKNGEAIAELTGVVRDLVSSFVEEDDPAPEIRDFDGGTVAHERQQGQAL